MRWRNALALMTEGRERFFAEQPSQLRIPFDLAFFAAILRDRIESLEKELDGSSAGDWGKARN